MLNSIDNKYMQRCIDIAKHGKGNVAPNPLVGCVIVHDGTIIGEGFHACYGNSHAEVNAIQSVKDKSLLLSSTLYVNLEPCCHQGKTPPCTDLILQHKIPTIVVGNIDVNPKVATKGIEILKSNGCEVKTGVLENECYQLNKRYFTFLQQHRPYIILKWAQTLDGFMDIDVSLKEKGESYWITNEALRYKVHKWRAEEDAIYVGANTVYNDNPQLNIRYGSGKNPIRISFFNEKIKNTLYHFFDNKQPTIIFNTLYDKKDGNVQYVKLSNPANYIEEMLHYLYEIKSQSIIIEGGKKTLEKFILKNSWDEARILIGNKVFGKGLSAPSIPFSPHKIETIEDDKILYIQKCDKLHL